MSAMQDPNPQVAGRGLTMLADAGVVVESGLLEAEARELNIGFVARMERGSPWVRLKAAASLDGKTALLDGQSQWITGESARLDGHRWRARACAILTGSGTVRDDDPQMTVRGVETTRLPLKIVVDSKLSLSPQARLFNGGRVLIVTAVEEAARCASLRACGADVLSLPDATGRVDLQALMRELGRRGINEVHVEGGSGLNGALLASGLVDELLLYLAPCLLGNEARGLFSLPALGSLGEKKILSIRDVRPVGGDWRVQARFMR